MLSSNTWQVSAKPLQGLHLLLLLSKHAAMCDKSRITVCQRNPSEWSDDQVTRLQARWKFGNQESWKKLNSRVSHVGFLKWKQPIKEDGWTCLEINTWRWWVKTKGKHILLYSWLNGAVGSRVNNIMCGSRVVICLVSQCAQSTEAWKAVEVWLHGIKFQAQVPLLRYKS